RQNPDNGKYNLCSKMTSAIGIMPDSTERDRKNHNIPNAVNLNMRLSSALDDKTYRYIAVAIIEDIKSSDMSISGLKMVLYTG
ncbi:hypothetical protein MBAV_001559, partial [Candidatus Magnetobacterium bavaricum]